MAPNLRYVRQPLERSGDLVSPVLVIMLSAVICGPPVALASQSNLAGAGNVRFTEIFEPASESRVRRAAGVLTPVEIERVQEALGESGHLIHPPSGILDSRTELALSRFQIAADLRACGCISYSTVLALGLRPVITHIIIAESGAGLSGADVEETHGVAIHYTAGIERPVPRPLPEVKETDRDNELESGDDSMDEPDEPIVRLFIPFFGLRPFVGVMGAGGD